MKSISVIFRECRERRLRKKLVVMLCKRGDYEALTPEFVNELVRFIDLGYLGNKDGK